VQGDKASGFPPGSGEYEDVAEILHEENNKIQKKSNKIIKPKKNIKQKTSKKNRENDKVDLVLYTVNANSMKKKEHSLKNILKKIKAGVFTIQETNYAKKGKLEVENYDIYEAIRNKEGGGTVIGVHKTLEPILIEEVSDEIELLVVEIKIEDKKIRVISGYGPQESWSVELRMKFFRALEEEVVKAEMAGRSVLISFDANSKMGSKHIPGDPHEMSDNGKIMEGLLARHALIVANGLEGKVKGVITRERSTAERKERSAIDLVCLSRDLAEETNSVIIDEDKKYALEKIEKTKKGVKITKSDHNAIITRFKCARNAKQEIRRIETFNLKNKEAQKAFKELTSEKGILTSKVNKEDDINMATKKFLKRLNGCIQQTFRKIRIKGESREENVISELLDKRRRLRFKKDKTSTEELKEVEEELATKCAESNFLKVQEELKDIEDDDNGFNAAKLWKLKKKLSPQTKEAPSSICDESGDTITSSEDLKKHTLNHYIKVLENRPMRTEHKEMQDDKEELCRMRIEIAKRNKSEPWSMQELETVLKYLKKNKSRDPNDLANELFHCGTAGDDMKEAILHIMNKVKADLKIPEAMEKCNITSIHKKGKKSDLDNYRGVFRVTVLRNILDRLVYNDVYPVIDENLTDANVGARKERNIRDNLFVLNAITNSVVNGNEKPCEVGVYDIAKAFDSLWAQECINDMYDAGCRDDKLVLMHLQNQNAQIAVKTSSGVTSRETIHNVIMQGTVTGGLCCTTTTDKLAKHVYDHKNLLYKYKGEVDVPPLLMIDDILTVSECGPTAVAMNATVNTFVETKKLTLKQNKCVAVHVGKKTKNCPDLKVHGEKMHKEESVKYLGDILHKNGKAKANIKERQLKAHAIVAEISAILSEIPLGKYRIQVGLQLRQAMFLNGVLFNSEVWPKLVATEITDLEKIDQRLLRTICKAHSKTPIEFLYLETGCMPLRYVISSRRIMYLYHILRREDKELVRRVFDAQKKSPTKGDFVELVTEDLIKIEESEDSIKVLSKGELKKVVKTKMSEIVLLDLQDKQKNHSKIKNIQYKDLKLQEYMASPQMTNTMVETMVALRSSMVRGVKQNFVSSSVRTKCPLQCRDTIQDTQRHMLECPALLARLSVAEEKESMSVKYDDIFSGLEDQAKVISILMRLLEIRDGILEQEDLPVGLITGPSLHYINDVA